MVDDVLIRKVGTAAELSRFIRLPLGLPDQRPNAVPALLSDERDFHDPRKNPALNDCAVERWIAWRNGHPVGRIMGIIHRSWNVAHNERTARFNQLDAIRDRSVVKALLDEVAAWARSRGADRVIGPFGFTDKDPQGLQIEGFEHLPVIATPTNPAWLPDMLMACGYAPYEDMISYRMDVPAELPAAYHRIAARCMRMEGIHRVVFRSKRELRSWVVPVLRLVNATYGDLLGFVPMTETEMFALARKYMSILDPAFVHLLVDAKNDPVAFVIAAPDMSEGLRKARGRLFPFGFLHILRAMRTSKQLDLFLGAVRPDKQGQGLTTVLGIHLLEAARERGFTHLDSHLVMERNTRMRAELERLGAVIWKRYRVYQKRLT